MYTNLEDNKQTNKQQKIVINKIIIKIKQKANEIIFPKMKKTKQTKFEIKHSIHRFVEFYSSV